MNLVLFKATLKRNWKLVLIFFCVVSFYLGAIISLIDPKDFSKVKELFGTMEGFLGAFGISIESMKSPLSYTASTFFGMLVSGFTMVFYLILTPRLIGKQVDNLSLSYILSAPISRKSVAITQGLYLVFSLLVIYTGMIIIGTLFLSPMGSFDFLAYFTLVSASFFISLSVALLSFLLSILFCDSRRFSGISSFVPLAFLLMSMLGNAGGETTKFLLDITPFGYLKSVDFVNGTISATGTLIFFIVACVILFCASVFAFDKKRLPI